MDWLVDIQYRVSTFLEQIRGKQTPGFFHYSLSGDLSDETRHWGLGNTVFAVKSYYTLGVLDSIPETWRTDIITFIKSFQTPKGNIFDPLIARKAFWRDKLSAVKHHDVNNFFHTQTIRAETRQSVCALELLGEDVHLYPKDLPTTQPGVHRYLENLNWTRPWGAGSHFSHLLFFLAHSDLEDKKTLIDSAIQWISAMQDERSGCWFQGQPSLQQKINGAMKVLTGLKAADRLAIDEPRRLIDMALGARNDAQACDHFNVIYVLTYADGATRHNYRHDEITSFAMDRLTQYHKHYWSKQGGFSYFLGKANDIYYNATVSKGLPEPDIHGTVLFLWGIALIAQILGKERELGFKEFIT